MQKQKKQMLVIILLLVIIVVAYFAMKTYNKNQAEEEVAKTEAEKTYITDFTSDEVTAFSYQNADDTLVFIKEDTWKCTNDESVLLDESAITTMLDTVAKLEPEDVVETEEDLTAYGFDEPTNVLTFTTDKGTVTLNIGMENSVTGQYYLTQNEGNTLYLVSADVPTAFEKALTDLEKTETGTEEVSTTEE